MPYPQTNLLCSFIDLEAFRGFGIGLADLLGIAGRRIAETETVVLDDLISLPKGGKNTRYFHGSS